MLDNATARQAVSKIVDPLAASMIRMRITADAVTSVAALATILVAMYFVPKGQFLTASLLIGLLSLGDLLDGTIARLSNTASKWGAFLDSTLDRVVDASVLISIAVYFYRSSENSQVLMATSTALVMGQMTSYIRARAESLGTSCKVGLAERAERTFLVWISLLLSGLGVDCLDPAMYLLAAITTFTVGQRILHVRKQLLT